MDFRNKIQNFLGLPFTVLRSGSFVLGEEGRCLGLVSTLPSSS